jgi:hypothetical protein
MTDGAGLTPVDRLLLRAEREIALLDRVRPLNTRAELARVAERWQAGEEAVPELRYGAAPDLSGTRAELASVVDGLGDDPHFGTLYAERAFELDREAAVVEALGTPAFAARAAARYPLDATPAGERLDGCAARWAELSPPEAPRVLADDVRDPRSLISAVHALVGALRLPVRVTVAPELASAAAAGDGVVLVRPGIVHSPDAARRMALHEVLGHVLPRLRAREEPLGLFRVGTAWGADDEEGRALVIEERAGLLGDTRKRELGVRHLAARAVRSGADWVELVRLIVSYEFAPRDAVRLALRVARGGGLAREIVYLPAFDRVRTAFAGDPELERFFERGRVGVKAARALRALGFEREGGDDRRVIGRLVGEARGQIDLRADRALRERPRREDEIDAKPLAPLEPSGAVVPPGE